MDVDVKPQVAPPPPPPPPAPPSAPGSRPSSGPRALAGPPSPAIPPADLPTVGSIFDLTGDGAWERDQELLDVAEAIEATRATATAAPHPEPKRDPDHWDALLREMTWLAKEFAKERRWKLVQCRKFATTIARSDAHLCARDSARARDEEASKRRRAAWIAKEVGRFWDKAARVAAYKSRAAADAARRGALDKHLDFVVGQTQRYSAALAARLGGGGPAPSASLRSGGGARSGAPAVSGPARPPSRLAPPPRDSVLDDEVDYVASDASDAGVDDEATLEEEERLAGAAGRAAARAEAAALADEADMPLEELVARYGYVVGDAAVGAVRDGGGPSRTPPDRSPSPPAKRPRGAVDPALAALAAAGDAPDEEGGDEYAPSDAGSEADDDEATLEEEERLAGAAGRAEARAEAAALADDADLPLEELMTRYGYVMGDAAAAGAGSDDDDGALPPPDGDDDRAAPSTGDRGARPMDADDDAAAREYAAVLAGGGGGEPSAAPGEPSGGGLLPTAAGADRAPLVPRPFLLKHDLRDYQQAGLDWLASIADRRINGILADEVREREREGWFCFLFVFHLPPSHAHPTPHPPKPPRWASAKPS